MGAKLTAQTEKKNRLARVLGFIVFVLLPIILIGVSVWRGQAVFGALAVRVEQQTRYNGSVEVFAQEATQIAPRELAPRDDARGEIALMGFRRQQATPVPLAFATNTPRPAIEVTIPPVNTSVPLATATPIPVEPLVLPTIIFPQDPDDALIASQPTAVPTRIPPITRNHDLVNIVLLGSDNEITADNTERTDTMIVVSINRDTGTVSMLSFPRDMYVFIPGLGMNRLNVAFGWGSNVGWTNGGFGLFRDVMIYNFGINVHFYAKVGISDLAQIIDLVGGINIAVDCDYQDYALVGVEVPSGAYMSDPEAALWVLPVGYYQMRGAEALWYARSRGNSSDFDRGRRQQQVIRAIFRQTLDSGQLANLPALWNEGIQAVETNLSFNDVLSLLPIALNLDSSSIESFTLIPTYHTQGWTAPDGANVQLPVYETLIPLLEDFYTPPTANQVAVRGATIRVLNGTDKLNLDVVAAERLRGLGFSAFSAGQSPQGNIDTTTLIDYTGQSKGSSSLEIAQAVNVFSSNIVEMPDANRTADFELILGQNYNSCPQGVLPITAPVSTGD